MGKTTCRAYTLRLNGRNAEDQAWRDALWATHESVNRGGRVFGDWLLTIRGGLCHTIADKAKDDTERRNRRILLALSWLSVESRHGAPEKFIVADGLATQAERNEKVRAAFLEILQKRGITAAGEWLEDCEGSLAAAIRDDAVWVNRSEMYDEAVLQCPSFRDDNACDDLLMKFFGSIEKYMHIEQAVLPDDRAEEDSEEDGESDASAESGKAKGKGRGNDSSDDKAKDLVQTAGQWLSHRFGKDEGANFPQLAENYGKIAQFAESNLEFPSYDAMLKALADFLRASPKNVAGIKKQVSDRGHKSATRNLLDNFVEREGGVSSKDLQELRDKACEDKNACRGKTGQKGSKAYADHIGIAVAKVSGFSYIQDKGRAFHPEYSVMLDHAARRVSIAHSWIRRTEAERQKFAGDAKEKGEIPSAVWEMLDQYCENRSGDSGANEAYRIRYRAISGWADVVKAWEKCKSCEDRVAAARKLQQDQEKFGDIRLFEDLAKDEMRCVWHQGGTVDGPVDPELLKKYVKATDAEFRMRKFKIPMYRHPDPLRHPIFCDFGNSRWSIEYDVHGIGKEAARTAETSESGKKARKSAAREALATNMLSMTLWNGTQMENGRRLRWSSARMERDLTLRGEWSPDATEVVRGDRLGRAAANVAENTAVRISGLFEQKEWNGRLQAPRSQLDAIARLEARLERSDRSKRCRLETQIERMKRRIRWLLTFSAKLQPREQRSEFSSEAAKRNTGRAGMANLQHSRQPGLRLLSVDLGHRIAASCAVWECVSSECVADTCRVHGHPQPQPGDMFLSVEWVRDDGRPKKEIYRRIGADHLPDDLPHPAPWARLERQFAIRLQGEDYQRKASVAERERVQTLRTEFGGVDDADETGMQRKTDVAVGSQMKDAVAVLRLAVQRHGDRAKIAWAMTAPYMSLSGDRKYYFDEAKDASKDDDRAARRNKRIEYLCDTLVMWYRLATGERWSDPEAKSRWMELGGLEGFRPLETGERRMSSQEKKDFRDGFRPLAESLLMDESLRHRLHEAWTGQWNTEDTAILKWLRTVRRWLMPSRNTPEGGLSRRYVGGLSLERIDTLVEFRRRVQIGFFTRQRPDGTRTECPQRFAQRTLRITERLREQRVKQLASRIVEAGLGVGRPERKGDKRKHASIDTRRPVQRQDSPCHLVVVENLRHYRPDETRSRRENRQLMNWCAGQLRTRLEEACTLYGLKFVEIPALYTSRQDSRTGGPGMRCVDVPIVDFLRKKYWRDRVDKAKQSEGKSDDGAEAWLLREWNRRLGKWLHSGNAWLCERRISADPSGWTEQEIRAMRRRTIRVLQRGGDIFVSANECSPVANGIQADLNAAANVGLRAVLDPDWPGRWWWVPCNAANSIPQKDKVKGCTLFVGAESLRPNGDGRGTGIRCHRKNEEKPAKKAGTDGAGKSVHNLWRDISGKAISGDSPGAWQTYLEYWTRQPDGVSRRVAQLILQKQPLPGEKPESSEADPSTASPF